MVLVVCRLTGGTSASAAEKCFNLHQTVAFSLQNNGELKALREEQGVREAGKVKAGLFANPVLELEGVTGALTGSPSENSLSLGISQEFLTAGKRDKRMQAADLEMEGFLLQIADRERLLTEELKTAFYDFLLAGKRLELAERSIELTRQLLDVTIERLAAGDIPELELNLARVEVARSEGRKIEAERELQPARLKLISLMGVPPGEEADFSVLPETEPFTKSLKGLRVLALTNRPDLKALHAEKMKGEAAIALAHAERIPDVTIGIAFKRESTAIDLGGSEARSRDYLIGLKLSVPIPLFDTKQSGIREAQARKGSAESRYLYLKNNIEREVESAYARLSSAVKVQQIYAGEILPQLEENLKLVQEAYRLGELGILPVIEEQKKFFEVNDSFLSAVHGRQTALIKLESAVAVDLTGGAQ
jgi:cobalt-zinc-cadmium efflux system outer membrane protein